MSKVIGGWIRGSLYDPATGDTVQFNRISTDISEFNFPNVENETATGVIYGGKDIELMIGFLESDGLAQLKTWLEDGTPLQAFIEGENQNIVWEESEELIFERGVNPNARDGVTVHMAQLVNVSDDPNIDPITNIAQLSQYSFGGSLNDEEIPMPIEGATVQAGADYAGVTSTTLTIEALDFAGSVLDSTTTSVGADGRFTASLLLPSNTYKINVEFNSGSDGGITLSNETVRLDGDSSFVTY